MRSSDDIKKYFKKAELSTNPDEDQQVLTRMLSVSKKTTNNRSAIKLNKWRIIMKNRITKFATAAVIIMAAVFSIMLFDKTIPAAYAIEQVIEACKSIRFLHVKQFNVDQEEPLEYWIKSNELGNVTHVRYYLPEHVSPEDGAKLVTWTPEKAELWFKMKNSYLIFQSKKVEGRMKSLLEQCQPELVMKKLLNAQNAGKAEINTQNPSGKQESIMITAIYKDNHRKEIYYINQATDLITYIEFYSIENGRDVLKSTTEFFDYNVAIDEKMFSIEDEVPEGVTVVDQLNQLIGIPQCDMTDEEAAIETVRQFFQALIDKDYQKAGLVFSGIPEEKAKEHFSKLNVTAIISISTPTPYPKCGPHSFSVPCELEFTTTESQKTTRKLGAVKVRCGDDEMHPDRWIIHGGI